MAFDNHFQASVSALTDGKTPEDMVRLMTLSQLISAAGGTRAVADATGVSQRTVQRWNNGTQAPGKRTQGRSRLETNVRTRHGDVGVFRLLTTEQRREMIPKNVRARVKSGGDIGFTLRALVTINGSTSDTRTRTLNAVVPRSIASKGVNAFIRGNSAGVERVLTDFFAAYSEDKFGGTAEDVTDFEMHLRNH